MTPDKRFSYPVTHGTIIISGILLASYFYPIFVTFSRNDYDSKYEAERCFWGSFCTCLGIFYMIGSDVQKFTQLKLKKGLITDGFFYATRNPNYLGEILIYSGFAIMSKSNSVWISLITVWLSMFATSMLMKELSLMKKDGWSRYREHSLLLLPRLFESYLVNYVVYAIIAVFARFVYNHGGVTSFLF